MIKMCLNLIGSQYKNIAEVEHLMYNGYHELEEEQIIKIKDNRSEIEKQLRIIESSKYIYELGI